MIVTGHAPALLVRFLLVMMIRRAIKTLKRRKIDVPHAVRKLD